MHAVLERLYDLPTGARTPEAALGMLGPEWERLLEAEPQLAELFEDGETGDADREEWLGQARRMVERYFTLEDPRRLEPAERSCSWRRCWIRG